MPAIGPKTIEGAAKAQLRGAAVAAGRVLIVDRERLRARGRRRRPVRRRICFRGLAAMSPLRVALVAGEHSGDQLGSKLMRALREARAGEVAFSGVGGEAMEAEGLESLFPISDIAVMGILPVLARLPKLLARIRKTAEAIVAARPDGLVIIDSPDFTHRVARRVRAGAAEHCRSSITSVRASGPGGPAAPRRCGLMSIACWRCCRSSPRPTGG